MTSACVLIWPYLFCHFATSITYRMTMIQCSIYNLNWYNFGLEVQKYFITPIMVQSQRTLYFTGLNLIRCTLTVYGKVNNENWTFYFATKFNQWFQLTLWFQTYLFFSCWIPAYPVIYLILYGIRYNIKPYMNWAKFQTFEHIFNILYAEDRSFHHHRNNMRVYDFFRCASVNTKYIVILRYSLEGVISKIWIDMSNIYSGCNIQ